MMLAFAGLLTGLLIGLTGVGGGAVMTPLLMLVFGVAPHAAIGTDLLFAAVTKSAAARVHGARGLIDWQVARRLWAGSLPGVIGCTVVLRHVRLADASTGWLKLAVGAAVLLTALSMLFQRRLHGLGERQRTHRAEHFKRWQAPLTVLAGLVLGVLVTLTSIGAGSLGVVLLNYLYPFRLTPARLVATDVIHAIPLALFAGAGHWLIGDVDFALLGCLLLGSIPGVLAGALLSSHLPQRWLRMMLVAILALVGSNLLRSVL